MKINKYFLYMAIGAAAAGFTACGDDYEDYQWAPVPDGQEVYFANNLATSYTIPVEETSFQVQVSRINTSSASTVAISAVAADDKTDLSAFDIPTSISFAAGAEYADITIGYDAEAIGPNNPQSITLSIADEASVTPYGLSSITIKASVPESWTYIGTGTYTYYNYYSGDDSGLKFYKSNANRYKIENWGGGVDFFFSEEADGTISVQDIFTGINNSSYGKVNVCERSDRFKFDGHSYQEDGIYYFATGYYVSAGGFAFNDYETFVLD